MPGAPLCVRAGGGSAWLSTRPVGCVWIEPVVSCGGAAREAKGPSLKRSLAQPATPAASNATTATLDRARERAGSTMLRMYKNPLVPKDEGVKHPAVNRALSLTAVQP